MERALTANKIYSGSTCSAELTTDPLKWPLRLFLRLNGYEIDVKPGEVYQFLLDVASGKVSTVGSLVSPTSHA
jgi:hypothetical protein